LAQNASNTDIFQAMAKLDMPIDYFEHIEYHFAPDPRRVAELTEFAIYFDKLRTEHDYNFMSENQMAKSFLTALQGKVTVQRSWAAYLRDKLKDLLAKDSLHLDMNLIPSSSGISAQAGEYQDTLGVVIEKGKKYLPYHLQTDSTVYNQEDARLYVGVSKPTNLRIQSETDEAHLLRSNVPFQLHKDNGTWKLELQAVGMQQVKIYSSTPLEFEGPDLKVEHNEADHTYTITHYGQPVSMNISGPGLTR
jgi:hypothetical protein